MFGFLPLAPLTLTSKQTLVVRKCIIAPSRRTSHMEAFKEGVGRIWVPIYESSDVSRPRSIWRERENESNGFGAKISLPLLSDFTRHLHGCLYFELVWEYFLLNQNSHYHTLKYSHPMLLSFKYVTFKH